MKTKIGSAAKIQTLTPNATKCPISFPNVAIRIGSAAKIQTLTPNATKCPISFPNVAIRTASCLKHSIGSKTSIENRL